MNDIKTAIIYTEESRLRNALKRNLRILGFPAENIHLIRGGADGVRRCELENSALLFLDWQGGRDRVQRVLEANKNYHRLSSHQAILLTNKTSAALDNLALEYQVLKILVTLDPDSLFSQLSQINLDWVSAPRKLVQLKEIDHLRATGRFEAAGVLCQKNFTQHPSDALWAYQVAYNHLSSGRTKDAEKILKQSEDSRDPRIHGLIAELHKSKGNYMEATESLISALKLSPYNISRLLDLGNIFLNIGRWDDALQTFDSILKFAENSREGRLGSGAAKALTGDFSGAQDALSKAANAKEAGAIFNAAGIVAIKFGNYLKAEHLYDTAYKMLSSYPLLRATVIYNLGILYFKNKNPDKSVTFFKRARKMDPSFKEAKENFDFLTHMNLDSKDKLLRLPHDQEESLGVTSNLKGSKWIDFSSFLFTKEARA